MFEILINDIEFLIEKKVTILDACKFVGIELPRFCYHESLPIAGNCRMCLVQLDEIKKGVASCVEPIDNGLEIYTETPYILKVRENILETLLINHPLDCPICDQGGECDLQDQSFIYGLDTSRLAFDKRQVEDINLGPLFNTIMTRCIHCTRCVRFSSEIAGFNILGTLMRGSSTEVTNKLKNTGKSFFDSEISGNAIDLCPVGALTVKPYAFTFRPWELSSFETIDTSDAYGNFITVHVKESNIVRILPRTQTSSKTSNWISDKTRFAFDAINYNRVEDIILKNFDSKNRLFEKKSWKQFHKILDTLLEKNQTILFIVNEEVNFESMLFLKYFQYFKNHQIKLYTVSNFNNYENFYIKQNYSHLNTVENCFIISSNIKTENTLLNTKLRLKYLKKYINFFSINSNFNSNFPLTYINISNTNLLKIFEGKNNLLSKHLISTKNPLIIFGNSFFLQLEQKSIFIEYLKKIIPNVIILNTYLKSNSAAISLLGIKFLSKKFLKIADIIFYFGLDDNLFNRNLSYLNNKALIICCNSFNFKNLILNNKTILLPTKTSFETQEYYLNQKNNLQKTSKIISNIKNSKSMSNIILTLFNNFSKTTFDSQFFKEFLIISKNDKSHFNLNLINKNSSTKFNNFIQQSQVEDFYLTNNLSKNSFTMLKCSQEKRKLFKNF